MESESGESGTLEGGIESPTSLLSEMSLDTKVSFVFQTFQGHKGQVNCIERNPLDDAVFASASDDCSVRLWDMREGNRATKVLLASSSPVPALCWDARKASNGGIIHYVANGSDIVSFDLRRTDSVIDREPVSSIKLGFDADCEVNSLASNKDGILAIADDEKMTVIDLSIARYQEGGEGGLDRKASRSGVTPGCMRQFNKFHSNVISKTIFKPKSSGELSSCGLDCVFATWDYRTGKERLSLDFSQVPVDAQNSFQRPIPPFVHDFTYMHEGRLVALTLGDGTVCLLDGKTGEILDRRESHNAMATCIAGSLVGDHFIAAGLDSRLCLWRIHVSDSGGEPAATALYADPDCSRRKEKSKKGGKKGDQPAKHGQSKNIYHFNMVTEISHAEKINCVSGAVNVDILSRPILVGDLSPVITSYSSR